MKKLLLAYAAAFSASGAHAETAVTYSVIPIDSNRGVLIRANTDLASLSKLLPNKQVLPIDPKVIHGLKIKSGPKSTEATNLIEDLRALLGPRVDVKGVEIEAMVLGTQDW